jgi:uncharacterized membrane protein
MNSNYQKFQQQGTKIYCLILFLIVLVSITCTLRVKLHLVSLEVFGQMSLKRNWN